MRSVLQRPGNSLTRWSNLCWIGISAALGALSLAVHLLVVSEVSPVDFLVYRYAVFEAFDGGNLYSANLDGPLMPEGGLPYTYTPFAVLFLAPAALFGPGLSFVLWSAATLAAFVWAMWVVVPQVGRKMWMLPLFTVAASVTSVVSHHLHFGQVNVFLMALVMADLFRSGNSWTGRRLPRGMLVGVAAAIKLTPGLFMLFFLLSRQRGLFWTSAISFMACNALAAVLLPTMSRDFATDILWGLGNRVSLDGLMGTSGNNSINGALSALGAVPRLATVLILLMAAGLILLAALRAYRRGDMVAAWLVIGLGAPLLSPVSWIHHWVYLLPALVYLTASARATTTTRWLSSCVALLILIGPEGGEFLFRHGSGMLLPVALVLRQALMVGSVILICWLAAHCGQTRSSMQRTASAIAAPASN